MLWSVVQSTEDSSYRTKQAVYIKMWWSGGVFLWSGEGEKNENGLKQRDSHSSGGCFQLKENEVGKYVKVASIMKKTSNEEAIALWSTAAFTVN